VTAEKKAAAPKTAEKHAEPRFKKQYKEKVIPSLMKQFGWENPFQCPKLSHIVVNIGVGEAKENIAALDVAKEELGRITGQLPQVRRAKKSISNFKLRENQPIAVRVTLRGDRMYEFFDRLVSTALPRVRDFRGINPKAFDGRGNYNLGLREQLIFPEIDSDKVQRIRGMNITFVTTAQDDEVGREFLGQLGLPFRKPEEKKKGKE
jgi:large subunit ribosomal protein L5